MRCDFTFDVFFRNLVPSNKMSPRNLKYHKTSVNSIPILPIARDDIAGRIRSGYGCFSPRRQFDEPGSLTEEYLPVSGDAVAVDIEYFRVRIGKLVSEFEECKRLFINELERHEALCSVEDCSDLKTLYRLIMEMNGRIDDNHSAQARLVRSMKHLF